MLQFLAIAAVSVAAASNVPPGVLLDSKLQFYIVFVVSFITLTAIGSVVESFSDARRARKLGCAPIYRRQAKWPLGIDLMKRMIDADKRSAVPEELPKIQREMGKSTWIQWVLGKPAILTVDPKNIQALLATQFRDFEIGGLRYSLFGPLLGRGIFTIDGKYWEHSRAMLRPQFAREHVADLELEENHVQEMFQALDTDAQGWTTSTNLGPLFFRLTLDSATEFLFGHSVESQKAARLNKLESREDLSKPPVELEWDKMGRCFDSALAHIGKRVRLRNLYWLHNPKDFQNDCSEVHRFADYYVAQALNATTTNSSTTNTSRTADEEKAQLAAKTDKYNFLHELVKSTRDPAEIRFQLLNILLAGRDTTAGLLGWTVYLLARHPSVFHKLRATVLNDFGPGTEDKTLDRITFSTLKSCTYLQHVMNEVLRLYPAVPMNGRQAIKDTTLPLGGGPDGLSPIFIKKGTDVLYSVISMHRRTDLWGEDAEYFRPDRWAGRRPGWEFLPFNGGPRICLGQQFALTEAGYVIVRLMQRFDGVKVTSFDEPNGEMEGEWKASLPGIRHQFGVTSAPLSVAVSLHEASSSA